jgi:hypothetical protein
MGVLNAFNTLSRMEPLLQKRMLDPPLIGQVPATALPTVAPEPPLTRMPDINLPTTEPSLSGMPPIISNSASALPSAEPPIIRMGAQRSGQPNLPEMTPSRMPLPQYAYSPVNPPMIERMGQMDEEELPLPGRFTPPTAMRAAGAEGRAAEGQLRIPPPYADRVYGEPEAMTRYREAAAAGPDKHKSAWHRFADAGVGFLVGGPVGAIAGAIDPDLIHNYRHNVGLNQLAREADQEMQGQSHERQGQSQYGTLTGEVYGTQEPTEQARVRDQAQQSLNMQRESQGDYRAERLRQQGETAAQKRISLRETAAKTAVELARRMRRPVDANAVKGTSLESFAGAVPPPASTRTYTKTEMGADGIEYGLTPDGQWEATQTAGGEPFRRYVKPERESLTPGERRRFERQDEQSAQKYHEAVTAADQEVAKAAARLSRMKTLMDLPTSSERIYRDLEGKEVDVTPGAIAEAEQALQAARTRRLAAQGAAESSGLVDIDAPDTGGKRNVRLKPRSTPRSGGQATAGADKLLAQPIKSNKDGKTYNVGDAVPGKGTYIGLDSDGHPHFRK